MSNHELTKMMSDLQSWGRKTVMFTMNMRALETGKMQENAKYMTAMKNEAEKTIEELWVASVSECSEPIKPAEIMRVFVTKILDWCASHRQQ